MKRFVYADHAATTNVAPEVLEEMLPCLKDGYGNPSSLYSLGREAAKRIADARARIATVLGAKPTEIYTKCGFSDYSAFYRAYKNQFGYPPSENVTPERAVYIYNMT